MLQSSRLASIFAAAALLAVPGAHAASPTTLTRATLDFDPAVFELVEDVDTGAGGNATLSSVDGLALFGLREFLEVPAHVTAQGALDSLMKGEAVAVPPYPLQDGPAGWTCGQSVADLKPPGVDSVFRCTLKDGDDLFLLSVMTNEVLTSPEVLAELRKLVASVRVAPAP